MTKFYSFEANQDFRIFFYFLESIRTIIELTEFMKFKESQKRWSEINEAESEYLTADKKHRLEEIKTTGEFVDQQAKNYLINPLTPPAL